MNIATSSHFPEDVLERYAMGKLSNQESEPLEEHLLVCVPCQQRLAELDEFLGSRPKSPGTPRAKTFKTSSVSLRASVGIRSRPAHFLCASV